MKERESEAGFTLMELIAVVAIVGILSEPADSASVAGIFVGILMIAQGWAALEYISEKNKAKK